MTSLVNKMVCIRFGVLAVFAFLIAVNHYAFQVKDQVKDENNEAECHYVSSRGILKSCNIYSKPPSSSATSLNSQEWKIKGNDVVYVQGSALKYFIQHVLPQIDCNFTLVTGDCDEAMPNDVLSLNEFVLLVDDKRLRHWYSQNLIIAHPKMTAIPIGLDYHSDYYKWWRTSLYRASEQEADLMSIAKSASNVRIRRCYANFHFSTYLDRKKAQEEVPSELVYYESERTATRQESWKRQAHFHFVLSPHGNGLDCHRTWEALVLGCIPIVKRSSIDPLYEGLPVLIVDHWYDVTQELLNSALNRFSNEKFNLDKLTLEYWKHKIMSVQV